MDKPVTVRLPDSQVRELMGLAVMDDTTLAELLRTAVSKYIEGRLADPELADKAEAAKQRQARMLESLLER